MMDKKVNKLSDTIYINKPQTPHLLHWSVNNVKKAQADVNVKLVFNSIPVSIPPILACTFIALNSQLDILGDALYAF
jgi:hypothetical protein